jgi:hypothetical protein
MAENIEERIQRRLDTNEQHCSPENLRCHYEQTLQTFQMLADIRFKLLALVPLVSGAGIAFLTGDPAQVGRELILAISLMGFIVTIGITIYNMRNSELMNVTLHRLRELERLLKLPLPGQFEGRLEHRRCFAAPIYADLGLALIYGTVLAAWMFLILHTALPLYEPDNPGFWWHPDAVAAVVTILVASTLVWKILLWDKGIKKVFSGEDEILRRR